VRHEQEGERQRVSEASVGATRGGGAGHAPAVKLLGAVGLVGEEDRLLALLLDVRLGVGLLEVRHRRREAKRWLDRGEDEVEGGRGGSLRARGRGDDAGGREEKDDGADEETVSSG